MDEEFIDEEFIDDDNDYDFFLFAFLWYVLGFASGVVVVLLALAVAASK